MSIAAAATPLDRVLSNLDGVKSSGSGWTARCPAHEDQRASLSISEGEDGRVLLCCFANCGVDRIVAALGLEMRDLFAAAERRNGHEKHIVATYDYRTTDGVLSFQVVRMAPKDFRQRRPDGHGGWVWKAGNLDLPYRLPELTAADPAATVFVVEGEKDADRLAALGLVATCNAGGAGKWRPAHSKALDGRDVVILPDNDDPGRQHADQVERSLQGIARSACTVHLPGIPAKGDLSDWLDANGDDTAALLALIADQPTLSISGDVLLDQVHAYLGRFVAYPSEHAHTAHTLWIAHTHLMDAWESTPRLAFLSPEPGSGKTRALEATEPLVPRPVEAINVTPAYLFRKVGDSNGRPTILFDEIDTVFGPKAKDNEDLRGLLNAGHRRGAVAGRCVVRGKVVETEEIPAYCAVAVAGLGGLPDTILSRSIIVRMRRRAPGEQVEPFRRRVHAPEAESIREQLALWASGEQDRARNAWPEFPAGIDDRDADCWESLLAVADLAGGDWPDRARVSAVTLVTDSKESTPSLGIRLLSDLRTVFGDTDALATDTILTRLHGLEESPWADLVGGKPLNARGLAQRLREYGVKSQTVRVAGASVGTAKGYKRADLWDAWSRYLPTPPQESDTSVTTDTSATETVSCQWCEARAPVDGGTLCPECERRMETSEEPNGDNDGSLPF